MSIQLKISNSLEKLAYALGQDLKSANANPLTKERIITQTNGMNRWLSICLAGTNRVFANFEFLRPNAFIDEVFKLAGMSKSGFYAPENLKWLLYSLLDSVDFKKQFGQIAKYYLDDDLKRMQLAAKVADLFDQYSIYRPDYIENWNRDENHPELAGFIRHENWQSWLWKQLRKEFPEQRDNDRVSQTNRLKDIIRNDSSFDRQLKMKFHKVSVFGLSVITPLHIDLFKLLSTQIHIIIYIVNPSPETFWYDTKSEKQLSAISHHSGAENDDLYFEEGNALLTNYGKVLKDTFLLLFDDDILNTLDDTNLLERPKETLLQKIQNDIYHNNLDNPISVDQQNLQDNSIQFSSSYTEVREIEALHNYLLSLFEKQPALLPKDIIVLTPDIDRYTPFISAVFDNVPRKNRIPYSIADRSYSGGDNIVGVIEMLLEMSEEEFTSERVVQLLDSAYIRKSYGISDVGLIREMVRKSNIRTGISGNREDDTNLVSWAYGMRRLILGYAIQGAEPFEDDGEILYPTDAMEGEPARETLRFIGFVDDLIQSLLLRKEKRKLIHWKEYLKEHILDRFIFVKDENDREYKYVLNKLAFLDEVSIHFNDEIGFDVFRRALRDLLFSETRTGEFITGSVTFSTMIPMRSLPFKVVAVLGLDNKKFPRMHVEPAFNLISAKPRRGDRNIKDNDKHLFLETLLSAHDNLYISFRGNSIKDNSKLPPSLLVDELISYIQKSYTGNPSDVKEVLLTRHPLHSFSRKYNAENDKLYSYSEEIIDSTPELKTKIQPNEDPDFSKVSLDQLIYFFKNPFKWYYNKILKIYYDENEVLLPEDEIFELNNLEKYSLKDSLVKFREVDKLNTLIDFGKKTGSLPLANMAQIYFESTLDSVASIKQIFNQLAGEKEEENEAVMVRIGDTWLEGNIQGIYDDRCLSYSLSASKHKDYSRKYILDAWLKHLVLMAAGKPKDSMFIWNFAGSAVRIPYDILSREEAEKVLSELLNILRLGQQQIMPFDPTVSFNAVYKAKDVDKSFRDLKRIGETGFKKEFFDPYFKKEIEQGYFNEENEGYGAKLRLLETAAISVWSPLFEKGGLFN